MRTDEISVRIFYFSGAASSNPQKRLNGTQIFSDSERQATSLSLEEFKNGMRIYRIRRIPADKIQILFTDFISDYSSTSLNGDFFGCCEFRFTEKD